jgi:acyl-CoA synthetase (AMP-forming)/AMP-acid ligase II
MAIGARLRELAELQGDRDAIVDERGACSYRMLHRRIVRLGNALRGLGLDAGDRVALLMPDVREYLEADYAIMSAGLVRVPLDPRSTRADLVALLRHAGARSLVTHRSLADAVDGLSREVESLDHVAVVGGGAEHDYEALLTQASETPLPDPAPDALATLNFSGGTTGAPKAIMLRHSNLQAVATATMRGFEIPGDAIFLNVRPLWPIAQVILMSHLYAGATVVLRRFDPERLAAMIEETGATRVSLVPTQLVRCLDHVPRRDPRLDRLEAIYVGGSRIPPNVFERALDIFGPKIGVLYGLTEAPVTCYMPPRALAIDADRRQRRRVSVGRVLPGYEVRLDGADGRANESGEALIRGGNVMAGYWQDEAATQATLTDGWLHTADIGQFDADGFLSIVGRLKEVIRSGASTIVPKEVEDVLLAHPAVAEVAVLGLPDAEWGEAVTAFVVARAGIKVSEHDLIEHCRARLASFKKPRAVRFVASLPRSHYGKVLRAQLLADAAR